MAPYTRKGSSALAKGEDQRPAPAPVKRRGRAKKNTNTLPQSSATGADTEGTLNERSGSGSHSRSRSPTTVHDEPRHEHDQNALMTPESTQPQEEEQAFDHDPEAQAKLLTDINGVVSDAFGAAPKFVREAIRNILSSFNIAFAKSPEHSPSPPKRFDDEDHDPNGPPVNVTQAFYFHHSHPLYHEFFSTPVTDGSSSPAAHSPSYNRSPAPSPSSSATTPGFGPPALGRYGSIDSLDKLHSPKLAPTKRDPKPSSHIECACSPCDTLGAASQAEQDAGKYSSLLHQEQDTKDTVYDQKGVALKSERSQSATSAEESLKPEAAREDTQSTVDTSLVDGMNITQDTDASEELEQPGDKKRKGEDVVDDRGKKRKTA